MTKFRLAIIAAAFVALIGLAGANYFLGAGRAPRSFVTETDSAKLPGGQPFTLVDQNGRPVTQDILKGKWTAVFFGYTWCPDFCPLSLQALAKVQKELGPKAKDFQIVFVSVDPERDTPENLKAYLNSGGMPKDTIGLTGTPEQVAAAVKSFNATAERKTEGDAVLYQHTTTIYLMDPQGRFDSPYAYDLPTETMTRLIREAMSGR